MFDEGEATSKIARSLKSDLHSISSQKVTNRPAHLTPAYTYMSAFVGLRRIVGPTELITESWGLSRLEGLGRIRYS